MPSKKSKSPSAPTHATSKFADSAWEGVWGLADDARIELHKQTQALIALAGGAAQGLSSFASKQAERVDEVAREGIIAGNQSGRSLVEASRAAAKKLRAIYQSRTTQIVAGAKDNVRNVADRASATARVMVAPLDEKKAA